MVVVVVVVWIGRMRVIVLLVCSSWRMRCQILASLYLCVCGMSLVMLHLHLFTSPVSLLFGTVLCVCFFFLMCRTCDLYFLLFREAVRHV